MGEMIKNLFDALFAGQTLCQISHLDLPCTSWINGVSQPSNYKVMRQTWFRMNLKKAEYSTGSSDTRLDFGGGGSGTSTSSIRIQDMSDEHLRLIKTIYTNPYDWKINP